MKDVYPNYNNQGVGFIEEGLKFKEKKILKDFLTYCGITAGESKLKEYRISILQIRDVMEVPFDEITLENLREFLFTLKKGYQRDWTKYGIKRALKRFIKFYYKDWSIRFDELRDVKFKTPSTQDKINKGTLLSEEDIEKLIRASDRLRDKAFIMLSFETGARPQEIRNLKWKDITFDDDLAKIDLYSGKTESARTVPVKKSVMHLKRWKQEYCFPNLRSNDYVFPSRLDSKKPSSSGHAYYMFEQVTKKAGLDKRVYGYLMRHSKLNHLYKTVPMQIHRKFAGHSRNSKQTATYEHMDNEDMMEVILDKVYNVEEITEEQKNKYEIKIANMEKDIMEFKKSQEELFESERALSKEQMEEIIRRTEKSMKQYVTKKYG